MMADQKEEDPFAFGELLEAKKLYDQSEAAIKELVSSGVLTPSEGKQELKTAQDALERTRVHVLQTKASSGKPSTVNLAFVRNGESFSAALLRGCPKDITSVMGPVSQEVSTSKSQMVSAELGGRGGGAAGRVGDGRGLGISEKDFDTVTRASPLTVQQALQGSSPPPNSSHDDFPLGTILEVLRLSDCLSVLPQIFLWFLSVPFAHSLSLSVCHFFCPSLSPLSSTVIFVSTLITVFFAGASGYGRMVFCHHLWSQKQGLEIRSHVWW